MEMTARYKNNHNTHKKSKAQKSNVNHADKRIVGVSVNGPPGNHMDLPPPGLLKTSSRERQNTKTNGVDSQQNHTSMCSGGKETNRER